MAQNRPPNYEAHLEHGESALKSPLLDLLLEHSEEDERLTGQLSPYINDQAKNTKTSTKVFYLYMRRQIIERE